MKYLSLFSGIGGFEKGIENAYERMCTADSEQKNKRTGDTQGQSCERIDTSTNRFTCIGYSEIDKYASAIYSYHYPTHTNYGDITKINASELPDFDLLVGGFPCQAFSIAGKRKGFDDTRGTLFFDIARILKEKHPRHFVLENVKGLLSHDAGRTFKTIIATLVELGYCVEWQVLNSKNHGVPQNRERVFIVGHLGGIPERKVFPIGEADGNADGTTGHVANTITARYEASQRTGTYIGESELNTQKSEPSGQDIRKGRTKPDDTDRRGGQAYPTNLRVRRLTPTECERLQGFPDGWTEIGRFAAFQSKRISDSQRYKCLGNAVTTSVVRAIIEKLTP